MRPTLSEGDRLLIVPVRSDRIAVGTILAFERPDYREQILVKRCAGRTSTGDIVLHGDNPAVSTDSRHFGPVPPALVVGRAVYRYGPQDRAGWL